MTKDVMLINPRPRKAAAKASKSTVMNVSSKPAFRHPLTELLMQCAPQPLEPDRFVDADELRQSFGLSQENIQEQCEMSRKYPKADIRFPLPVKKRGKQGEDLWSLSAVRFWYFYRTVYGAGETTLQYALDNLSAGIRDLVVHGPAGSSKKKS